MAVRMKDIAKELGVSVVTVSKVLRNHDDISAETRERVMKLVREMNYSPNLAARALVTGKSYMVGMIVPDLIHPFFAQIAKGASKVLRKQNYSLILSSSEENPDLERREIEQMLSRHLDGLLIASAQWAQDSFQRIDEQRKPYVLVDRNFAGIGANFVGTDDTEAGLLATEHLIANGCRRLAHIGGQNVSPAMERFAGYKRALAARDLPFLEHFVATRADGDDSGDITGYHATKEFLRSTERPDGIVCYNDPTAMGAMMALLEEGIRIPEDVALIGCGDVHYAAQLRVPLSSIDQDSDIIGQQAGALMLDLINGKEAERQPQTILMKPKVIARQSSVRGTVENDGIPVANDGV